MKKNQNAYIGTISRTVMTLALAASLCFTGAEAAFADPVTPYWTPPDEARVIDGSATPATPARYAYSIGFDFGSKNPLDPYDYEGDSTSSAHYAATAYEMGGYTSYYSFYPTYGYLNGTNPSGTGRLESDVVFLCGHASPVCLLFGDTGGSPDNMCGVYYTNDLDSRSTTGYWYVGLQQLGRDLSGVKLISFIGCDTAGFPGDAVSQANNLCTRAVASGASAALGFTDEIYPFYSFNIFSMFSNDPHNESGPMWIQRYNDALATGCTFEEAVDYANVIDTHENWGGSAHIEGNSSTTITPF